MASLTNTKITHEKKDIVYNYEIIDDFKYVQ